MKRYFPFFALTFEWGACHGGQTLFLDKVKIEYAKTVATWPLMKEIEPEWFEEQKEHMPKETVSYFQFCERREPLGLPPDEGT